MINIALLIPLHLVSNIKVLLNCLNLLFLNKVLNCYYLYKKLSQSVNQIKNDNKCYHVHHILENLDITHIMSNNNILI